MSFHPNPSFRKYFDGTYWAFPENEVFVWKQNNLTTHVGDALRTVVAGCFHRNVLVLVKVDASITAAEQLTAFTSSTSLNFYHSVIFERIHKHTALTAIFLVNPS